MADRELSTKIVYQVDQGSANKAAQSAENIGKSIKDKVGTGAAQSASSLDKISTSLNAIASLQIVQVIGDMSNAMMEAARSAAQFYGNSQQGSAEWLQANRDLENSYNKIGLVILNNIVPYMTTAANISKDISDFISKNPGIAKVAQGVLGATSIFGQPGNILGIIKGISPGLAKPAYDPGAAFSDKQLQTYLSYARQEEMAQKSFLNNLTNTQRNFEHSQQVNVLDFNHQMLMTDESFQHSKMVSYQNYYHQEYMDQMNHQYEMMVNQRSFDRQQEKTLADHNRELYWMNYDHNYNIRRAAEDRDAQAMIDENRSFDIQKMRNENDFEYQQMWTKQQHEWEVSDMNEAFTRQEGIRKIDFNYQQNMAQQELDFNKSIADQNFKYTQDKAREQNQWQINESRIEFNQQRELRRQQLEMTLADEVEGVNDRMRIEQQFNQDWYNDMAQVYNQARKLFIYPTNSVNNTTNNNTANVNIQSNNVNEIMDAIFGAFGNAMSALGR